MAPSMQPVSDSSMISAEGFENGELYVTMRSGGNTYAYPCTDNQYSDFQASSSKGGWIHQNLRGKDKKVEGRKVQDVAEQ